MPEDGKFNLPHLDFSIEMFVKVRKQQLFNLLTVKNTDQYNGCTDGKERNSEDFKERPENCYWFQVKLNEAAR